jgi:hypothetical protein
MHQDWVYFKSVIKEFCLTGDKATTARGKLLKLTQGTMSLSTYNSTFMRLVRDSHTGPAEPWLVTLYLNGLFDRTLRRAVALQNGNEWRDVTALIKHVSTITAFDNSVSPARPPSSAADRSQSAWGRQGAGRGRGRGFQAQGGQRATHQPRTNPTSAPRPGNQRAQVANAVAAPLPTNQGGRRQRGRGRGKATKRNHEDAFLAELDRADNALGRGGKHAAA